MKNKIIDFIKTFYIQFLMAIVLIILAIIFKQSIIKLIPCVVSLIVYMFDSKLNRYGKLLGAINAVIYSIGYIIDGLYGSAISALAYSAPIQIVTFILWTKNKEGKGTKLHVLKPLYRILSLAAILLISAGYILIFKDVKSSSYTILQGFVTSVGFVSAILIMFGYLEGMYINLVNVFLNLVLYCLYIFVDKEIAQITYVAMNLYSFAYIFIGCFNWTKIYKEQQLSKLNKEVINE